MRNGKEEEGEGREEGAVGSRGCWKGWWEGRWAGSTYGYHLHLSFGISSPSLHGQCKVSPSCTPWSQGTAVPRASIRLVPPHAKLCSCSVDEGPKSVPWGPSCSSIAGFHGNTSQLPIWRQPWYPHSEETLKVHKPFG